MRVDEHTINLDETPLFYRSAEGPDEPVPGPDGPVLRPAGRRCGRGAGSVPPRDSHELGRLGRVPAVTGGIAPDLIGFGRSGKGGHLDYSLAGLAGFLERFLAEVHMDAVKLVAHDWGVGVGLTLAARHPERIERLVLLNAPPLFGGFPWPRLVRWWRFPWIGEGLMGSTTRGMLARTLRQGSVRPEAWTEERITTVWDQFDQGTQRAILRLVRSTNAALPTRNLPRPAHEP